MSDHPKTVATFVLLVAWNRLILEHMDAAFTREEIYGMLESIISMVEAGDDTDRIVDVAYALSATVFAARLAARRSGPPLVRRSDN